MSHLWLKPIFAHIHALQADEAVSELASKYVILVSTALQRGYAGPIYQMTLTPGKADQSWNG